MTEAKRHFVQGLWGRSGRAIPDPQVSELDNVIPLRRPTEDLRQGRDATNPVPRFSMLSGKPMATERSNEVRGLFWRSYFYSIAGIAVCSAILAYWPN